MQLPVLNVLLIVPIAENVESVLNAQLVRNVTTPGQVLKKLQPCVAEKMHLFRRTMD
ncbi:hypothetical protein D3C86_1823460 [compost metagenome]